jgi:hypothetical protein
MPRVPRCRNGTDAACYHVLNRGHARETIFQCLMGNHFHLVLQLTDPWQSGRGSTAGRVLGPMRWGRPMGCWR